MICSSCLKLEACSREGKKEDQIVEFQYKEIDSIAVDDEEMAFVLNVKLNNKPNKEIKVFTGFYLYMYDCVRKALDECKELKKVKKLISTLKIFSNKKKIFFLTILLKEMKQYLHF